MPKPQKTLTLKTSTGKLADLAGMIQAKASEHRVRDLNDEFRKTFKGGKVFLTTGVQALTAVDQAALVAALQAYDEFDDADDPHGEHDYGTLDLMSRDGSPRLRALWKIDYYDLLLERASPDPASPDVTLRVMTIMLDSEY